MLETINDMRASLCTILTSHLHQPLIFQTPVIEPDTEMGRLMTILLCPAGFEPFRVQVYDQGLIPGQHLTAVLRARNP